MAMLTVPVGTIVRLNGAGLAHQHKLTRHGGDGIVFGHGHLTAEEAAESFAWIGDDKGRYAIVRSNVSGREGMIARDMLRNA